MVVGLAFGSHPFVALVACCIAGYGISGSLPTFWNLPTAFLGQAAAAGGIAIINSVGNIRVMPRRGGWVSYVITPETMRIR
jgi:MFS transporter, ACS family, tartrate transporter